MLFNPKPIKKGKMLVAPLDVDLAKAAELAAKQALAENPSSKLKGPAAKGSAASGSKDKE